MAIVQIIDVRVKDKKAVKAMKSIGDAVVDTKNDVINLERELLKLQNRLAKSNARDVKGRRKLNALIDKTKRSIKQEKNALKSLTLQKSIADKATRKQIRSNRKLNQSYFKSKESLTDVNRLTAEFALKIKAVKNIFFGATEAVKKFAKAQKLAFAASVIGIALIALVTILAFWKQISEAVTKVNKKLEKQREDLKRVNKSTQLLIDLKTSEIELAEKLKLPTEDLVKEKIKLIKIQQILNDQLLITLERQALILKAEAFKITLREKFLRLLMNSIQPGSGDALLLERQLEASEKYKDFQDLIVKSKKTQIDLASLLFDIENPDPTKRDKVKALDLFVDDNKIENEKKVFDAELERVQSHEDDLFKISVDASVKKAASEAEFRDIKTQAQIDAFEEEQFIQLLKEELNDRAKLQGRQALNDLAFIFGEQSKIGKAAAITGIIIDQVSSASRAISALTAANAAAVLASPLTLGQPWVAINTISTGLGIVAAAVAAKKAISEIGGGGGSISSPSFRQGGQSAPSFNVVGTSGTNQLAQALSTQDQPIQAFVVGSNVTTQQALDRNIVQTATIG